MKIGYDRSRLATRIADVLRREERSEDEIRDIVFHMVDWLEDLASWTEVARDPDRPDEEVSRAMYCFLAHVPAHLAAAHRLVMGSPVEDVFGIGATVRASVEEPSSSADG